jgi:hypothetical protein
LSRVTIVAINASIVGSEGAGDFDIDVQESLIVDAGGLDFGHP